jgi:hypothetical protein
MNGGHSSEIDVELFEHRRLPLVGKDAPPERHPVMANLRMAAREDGALAHSGNRRDGEVPEAVERDVLVDLVG